MRFSSSLPLSTQTNLSSRDKKETLTQNYRRLGLLSRLKTPTGGTETQLGKTAAPSKSNPFAITTTEKALLSEAKVERDEDGNIIRVISRRDNPLNDPLNSDDEEEAEEWDGLEDGEEQSEVMQSLLYAAANPAPKKPRHMSDREVEWLENLIEAHGEDVNAMARDRKLNPMQQTAKDISRRLKKFNA